MELLENFISSLNPSDPAIGVVRDYTEWQLQRSPGDFFPSSDDDVDLRTYLHYLRMNGADQDTLEEQISALKHFYHWAITEKVILHNPFDDYDFDPPFFTSGQTEPGWVSPPDDLEARVVDRLLALSQISEALNKSVDIQGALENTLTTLLRVMNLKSGWVSMLTKSHLSPSRAENPPPHGFELAITHGLPPGLERDDCGILREPPACRCQHLLTEGRLTHPVNIVECTRLRDSREAKGDNQDLRYHASVPLISQGKPVGLINVASPGWQFLTSADLHFLSAVSAQIVAALERAHFYEDAEKGRIRLENELQVARQVQAGLMPVHMPEIPGYDLACAWYPALQVSGDFYDFFPLQDGCWGMVIGDVADKGTAAALYMAMVHSLILSGALRHRSPAAVLDEVNQTVLRQSSSHIMVTVFLAVLDPKKHTLRYANAGHNPPFLKRASGEIEKLTLTGPFIGMMEGLGWNEAAITLKDGDTLVLYTDGVTEARNPQKAYYEDEGLVAAITSGPRKARELLRHIEVDLETFTAGEVQQDDVTFFIVVKD